MNDLKVPTIENTLQVTKAHTHTRRNSFIVVGVSRLQSAKLISRPMNLQREQNSAIIERLTVLIPFDGIDVNQIYLFIYIFVVLNPILTRLWKLDAGFWFGSCVCHSMMSNLFGTLSNALENVNDRIH